MGQGGGRGYAHDNVRQTTANGFNRCNIFAKASISFGLCWLLIYYFRLKPFGILFRGGNHGAMEAYKNFIFNAPQSNVEFPQRDSGVAGTKRVGMDGTGGPSKGHVSRQCIFA